MDPISVALLVGLATGLSGEVGKQAWAGLTALVKQPFRRHDSPQAAAVSSGEAEVAALESTSTPEAAQTAAQTLSTVLAVRAAVDPDFLGALQEWHEHAKTVPRSGGADNRIYGGSFQGPVIQGQNFSTLNIGTPGPALKPEQQN